MDLLASLLVAYFFFSEVTLSAISGPDARWLGLGVLAVAGVFVGAHLLRARAKLLFANLLLLALAVPATLFGALLVALDMHPIAFR